MTEPRLSTVFDYSDLRLHPDGTRVYQKTSNRRPVLAKVTVQDARANWIAKDAGGSARVAKYRKRAPKEASVEDVDAEVIEFDDEAEKEKRQDELEGTMQSDGEESDTSRLPKKRAAKKPPDQRKFKRRKFEASYDYLDTHAPHAKSTDTDAVSEVQSVGGTFPAGPSPDLLKVIHRFASEFYTERGQLLNISREYRKERKKRVLERKAKLSDGGPSRASKKKTPPSRSQSLSSSSDSDGGFPAQNSDDLSEDEAGRRRKLKGKGKERERDSDTRRASAERDRDGGDDGEGDEALNDETDEIESESDPDTKFSTKRKKRQKSGREKILPSLYTDMYKVFDGSAMMALGMLVQEHIASLLNPDVPESWSKEARRVYTEYVSSGDEEDGSEQLQLEENIRDKDNGEQEGEDGESEADDDEKGEEEEKGEEDEKGEEEDEESEEEEDFSDEEDDNDQQDEGTDTSISKDDILEQRNENEHHINPYLPASSRPRTQSSIIHVDSEAINSGERTTGSGLEDDDDPIEYTSDEPSRSENTVHSDSEDEFI